MINADRHYWRTADGRLVPHGHPDADTLAHPEGHPMPDDVAREVGLLDPPVDDPTTPEDESKAPPKKAAPDTKAATKPVDKSVAKSADK